MSRLFTRALPRIVFILLSKRRAEFLAAVPPLAAADYDILVEPGLLQRMPELLRAQSDLAAALDAEPRAKAEFGSLNGANRYAVLWRVHTARPATSAASPYSITERSGRNCRP